ncbi:MAG: hypothetical protein HY747_03995 [Elusimicrobia bacterium]|nr:hypothetical protein [Elusimicrobiota bacterium]
MAVFSIATLPYFIALKSRIVWVPETRVARRFIGIFFAVSVYGLCVLAALGIFERVRRFSSFVIRQKEIPLEWILKQQFPAQAFDFIKHEPELIKIRAYVDWGGGGYAQWRAGEDGLALFWDGRYLFIELLKQAVRMADTKKRWNNFLKAWKIGLVVRAVPQADDYYPHAQNRPNGGRETFMRTKTALFYDSDEWALIWWDATSVVFVRRRAVSPGLLTSHEYKIRAPVDFYKVGFAVKTGKLTVDEVENEMLRNIREAGPNFLNTHFLELARSR